MEGPEKHEIRMACGLQGLESTLYNHCTDQAMKYYASPILKQNQLFLIQTHRFTGHTFKVIFAQQFKILNRI